MPQRPVGPTKPGGQRGETPEETHYRSLAVREEHAQEHSLSLAEYPAAIRLRKKDEKKISIRGSRAGPGQQASRAGHTKNQLFRLNPGEPVALRARTQLRTHARTNERNEADFPVGEPKGLTSPNLRFKYIYLYKKFEIDLYIYKYLFFYEYI